MVGVFARNTMFGFPADEWKPWRLNGLDVQVARDFNISMDSDGGTLIYPEGDTTVAPSGRMPSGGHFFDCIVRQDPIDEERLNPEDNLEEYGLISQADLDHIVRATHAAALTGRGVIATFGGTAFGDIALVRALRSSTPGAFATSLSGTSPPGAGRIISIRYLNANARQPS